MTIASEIAEMFAEYSGARFDEQVDAHLWHPARRRAHELYAEARSQSLCGRCRFVPAVVGCAMCEACRRAHNAAEKRNAASRRRASGAAQRPAYRCGRCGLLGHSARTCGRLWSTEAA